MLEELDSREGSVIVFVKTKRGADQLAEKLQGREHNADAIHGDLQQRKRDRVMRAFRQQKSRILVATDVAARGLDVPHIQHVINYDLPTCPEDYIHRIGRTGRAGASGFALSFVSPDDSRKWKDIQRLMQGKEMPSTQNAYAPRAQQPRTGGRPNPFQSHSKPSGFAPREGSRDSYAPRESSRDNYAPREGSREGYAPREASRAPREGYAPREASRAPREGYAPREGSREGYAPRERSREGYAPREGGFRGEPRANGGFRSESKPAFREGARPNPFKTDARPNPFKSDSRPNPFKTEGRANPFKSDARPSRFKTDGKPGQFKAGGKPNPFKSDAKPFKRKEESGSSTLTVANKDGFKKPGKFKAFFSKKRPA